MNFIKKYFTKNKKVSYKGIDIRSSLFLDKFLWNDFEKIYQLTKKYFLFGNFIDVSKENVYDDEFGPLESQYKIEFKMSDIPLDIEDGSYPVLLPKKGEKIPIDIQEEMTKEISKSIPGCTIRNSDSFGCLYVKFNRSI